MDDRKVPAGFRHDRILHFFHAVFKEIRKVLLLLGVGCHGLLNEFLGAIFFMIILSAFLEEEDLKLRRIFLKSSHDQLFKFLGLQSIPQALHDIVDQFLVSVEFPVPSFYESLVLFLNFFDYDAEGALAGNQYLGEIFNSISRAHMFDLS